MKARIRQRLWFEVLESRIVLNAGGRAHGPPRSSSPPPADQSAQSAQVASVDPSDTTGHSSSRKSIDTHSEKKNETQSPHAEPNNEVTSKKNEPNEVREEVKSSPSNREIAGSPAPQRDDAHGKPSPQNEGNLPASNQSEAKAQAPSEKSHPTASSTQQTSLPPARDHDANGSSERNDHGKSTAPEVPQRHQSAEAGDNRTASLPRSSNEGAASAPQDKTSSTTPNHASGNKQSELSGAANHKPAQETSDQDATASPNKQSAGREEKPEQNRSNVASTRPAHENESTSLPRAAEANESRNTVNSSSAANNDRMHYESTTQGREEKANSQAIAKSNDQDRDSQSRAVNDNIGQKDLPGPRDGVHDEDATDESLDESDKETVRDRQAEVSSESSGNQEGSDPSQSARTDNESESKSDAAEAGDSANTKSTKGSFLIGDADEPINGSLWTAARSESEIINGSTTVHSSLAHNERVQLDLRQHSAGEAVDQPESSIYWFSDGHGSAGLDIAELLTDSRDASTPWHATLSCGSCFSFDYDELVLDALSGVDCVEELRTDESTTDFYWDGAVESDAVFAAVEEFAAYIGAADFFFDQLTTGCVDALFGKQITLLLRDVLQGDLTAVTIEVAAFLQQLEELDWQLFDGSLTNRLVYLALATAAAAAICAELVRRQSRREAKTIWEGDIDSLLNLEPAR